MTLLCFLGGLAAGFCLGMAACDPAWAKERNRVCDLEEKYGRAGDEQ